MTKTPLTADQTAELINHLITQIRADQIALVRLGVHPPDATTREGQLLSDLSEAGLREQEIARILGHEGTPRELPETARRIMNR